MGVIISLDAKVRLQSWGWLGKLVVPVLGLGVVLLNPPDSTPFYYNASPISLQEQFLRLALIPVFLLLSYGLGGVVLNVVGKQDKDGWPTAYGLFAGFSSLTLLSFVLNAAVGYRFSAYLSLYGALSFLSAGHQIELMRRFWRGVVAEVWNIRASGNVQKVCLFVAVVAVVAAMAVVVLAKAVYPDYGGDVFYYLTYYQQAIARQDIVPVVYDYLVYFPAKASGLHYVVAILCGVESLPVASFVYYIFLCVTCASFVARLTNKRLYLIFVILLVSTNVELLIFTNNFSKTNLFGATLVFFLAYVLYDLCEWGQFRLSRKCTFLIMILYGVQASFFTLQVHIFSVLIGLLYMLSLMARRVSTKKVVVPMILALVLCVIMLGWYNLQHVGFADVVTIGMQLKLDPSGVHEYLPSLKMFEFVRDDLQGWQDSSRSKYFRNAAELVSSTGFLGTRFLDGAWLLLAVALVSRKGARGKSALAWLAINVIGFSCYVLACAAIDSDYIRKHSLFMFGILFKINIYVASFVLFEQIVLNNICSCWEASSWKSRVVFEGYSCMVVAVMVTTACRFMPFNYADDIRERVEFLVGNKTVDNVFRGYYPELASCGQVMKSYGGRILSLSAMGACFGYSNDRIMSLLSPDAQPVASLLFGSDAETVLPVLRGSGVRAFLLDTKQQPMPYFYSPMFAPEAIRAHFKVLSLDNPGSYLLLLDAEGGVSADEKFLDMYVDYRDAGLTPQMAEEYAKLGRFYDSRRFVPPVVPSHKK